MTPINVRLTRSHEDTKTDELLGVADPILRAFV